jgi:small GTP-binding protein
MSDHHSDSYLFKSILIGNTGAGKSCLLERYVNAVFYERPDVKPTVGVEFGSKEHLIDGNLIKNHVWDTAGQERYKAVIKSYYRNTTAAFFVFDITDYKSFVDTKMWLSELDAYGKNIYIKKILVANKADLADFREVTTEEASNFAKENDMTYFETSAKSGKSVNNMFSESFKDILQDIKISANTQSARR